MKIKKIICMILVICLLGGLLTVGSSAAGWLMDAVSAVSSWLKTFDDIVDVSVKGIFDFFKTGDSTLLTSSFKPLPTNTNALRFTTVNCQFVTMSILHEFMSELVKNGITCELHYLTDGAGNTACFIRAVEYFNGDIAHDLTQVWARPAFLTVGGINPANNKWLAGVDDNSTLIAGDRNYNGSNDTANGANEAYFDIENYTENGNIINNSNDITVNNDNSSHVNNFYNHETNQVFEYSTNNHYNSNTVIYNSDTKNYEISYEKNNNEYVMLVEYHIQYTVVNYVDLQETYILYYELPDGRNSFDMTVDELAQYSDSFDVINYASSADNDDLIALYPFNGNQENIAFSGSPISWLTGNSITYQETSGFGAALYLGNGDHKFSVSSTTLDTSGATEQIYCVSFRYYYSPRTNATAVYYPLSFMCGGVGFTYDGYNDKFYVGQTNNITSSTGAFSGSNYSSVISPLPIGQWVNITVQTRHNYEYGVSWIYLFVNGVKIANYQTADYSYPNNGGISSSFAVRNGDDGYSYIDEIAVIKDAYFSTNISANFSPPLQPYDTNLILTLPSLQAVTVDSYVEDGKTYYYVYSPDQLWKPTIAVASDINVTKYYLGGVRPSLPKRGYVWVPISDNQVGTVQIYDGSGWLEVASRIWTGSRWVSSSNYNISTNGTYNDIVESPPPPVIADEQSFWAWCVESFDTLIATIKSVGGGGGVVADPDVIPEIIYPGIDSEGNTTEESTSIFDIVTDVVGGIVDIIGEVVGLGGNVGEFFGNFFDGVGDAFGVLNPNNQNGLFYVEVE